MKRILITGLAVLTTAASWGSITTSYSNMGNMSATVDTLTKTLTVAAGDVVVMVGASNKKASVNELTFTSTAGAVTALDANTQLGTDPNPNSYLSYVSIATAGTYDFIGTADALNMTATLGLYKLSADSGVIELAASNAKKYAGLAPGASLSVTNFMSWGSNENSPDYDGIVTIGVGSSMKGTIANTNSVGGFVLDFNKAEMRLAGSSDRTGKNNVKHIWDITNADPTKNESGGITGAAFAEVIPEPATLGMVVLTGSSLLLIRRRFML